MLLLLLLLLLPLIGIFLNLGPELFHSIDSVLLVVVPLVVYSDAKASKDQIIKDNRGKSGVYR
jgi:ACR3 family arsenite efflux pump ArsB